MRGSSIGSPMAYSTSASTDGTTHQDKISSTAPDRCRRAAGSAARAASPIAASTATPITISVAIVVDVLWKFGGMPAESSVSAACCAIDQLIGITQKSCPEPRCAASTSSGTHSTSTSARQPITSRARTRKRSSSASCAGISSAAS